MKSIFELFRGRFANYQQAIVQRCDANPKNHSDIKRGYTEHWPTLTTGTSLIVVAIGDSVSREIWCGRLVDQVPSTSSEGRYRFVVDEFIHVGTHTLAQVSDADFYGNKGGGGSRVVVRNAKAIPNRSLIADSLFGENEKREVWVRKNHRKFRDPVFLHWQGVCAVLGHPCNNLLVSSHIKPWSISSAEEKVDPHNGLLLSVALDKLFDVGLIGFSDSGQIVLSQKLTKQSIKAFGVSAGMKLSPSKLTAKMRSYLAWHRDHFGLPS